MVLPARPGVSETPRRRFGAGLGGRHRRVRLPSGPGAADAGSDWTVLGTPFRWRLPAWWELRSTPTSSD